MDPAPTITQLGRFRLLRPLGEGAQGQVFLAHDPHLDRAVAIKTLHVAAAQAKAAAEHLAHEARTVSKLTHPHIVTLYDAGEMQGAPYLVFEYVEGETLDQRLRRDGRLPRARAVEVAMQVLEALAYAHARGVVHRDIKPSNIIFDAAERARVMDFGIAAGLSGVQRSEFADGTEARAAGHGWRVCGFAGTPPYCAPEYLQGAPYTPPADVFSVAMLLYQMLTGRTAIQGGNAKEVMARMVSEAYTPPSRHNAEVDEALGSLVMRGLAKRPEERFASAEAMREALQKYLAPETETVAGDGTRQSTVEFLLRRMRSKPEFPALSESIRTINRIAASDTESVSALSGVILKDFALTNKLLKLVNAAVYGQFGKVSTISRAVVIIGFEALRAMAVSLMLFNHLQNKSQAETLKDEVAGSLFSGLLARELIGGEQVKDTEEAFICAVYQSLGKLLALYYFHDEALEISRLVEHKGVSEQDAAKQVLGISYDQLAVEIARLWNFPARLVYSMERLAPGPVPRQTNVDDRFRLVANMAEELRQITTRARPEAAPALLANLATRYQQALAVPPTKLGEVANRALKQYATEAAVYNVNLQDSRLIRQAELCTATLVNPTAESVPTLADTLGQADLARSVSSAPETPAALDSAAVLTAGIQDITETLVSDYKLNDLLRMILETMYRGMGFSHVLLAVRDARTGQCTGRFGLGEGIEQLLPRVNFVLNGGQDLFSLALKGGRDIIISDTAAANVCERLPEWFRKHVNAPAFLLFPIMVDRNLIGFFYADQLKGKLKIEPREATLLVTLRNQAVLAFKSQSARR